MTLVVQGWGGLLGLTLPMDIPGVFNRLIVMNTVLGTGDSPLGEGFLAWRAFSNSKPDMDVAALMRRSVPALSAQQADAYTAPFPDARYKAGVRRFPNLVPDHPEADGAALSRVGMKDPVLGAAAMASLRKQIRACPAPLELPDAGHFVQESGDVVAQAALAAFQAHPGG